jgi:hypothetical protein
MVIRRTNHMERIPQHDSMLDDPLRRDEVERDEHGTEYLDALEEEMAEDDGGDW